MAYVGRRVKLWQSHTAGQVRSLVPSLVPLKSWVSGVSRVGGKANSGALSLIEMLVSRLIRHAHTAIRNNATVLIHVFV